MIVFENSKKGILKTVLLILGILFYHHLYAQINISGEWKGLLRQNIMGSFTDSPYQLTINQKADSIYGIAYIEASEFLSIYAKMSFTGTIKQDRVLITEQAFLEGTDLNDAVGWCIKKLELVHLRGKSGYRLKGSWTGYSNTTKKDCEPGILFLDKESAKFTGLVQSSVNDQLLEANIFVSNLTLKEKKGLIKTYKNEGVFKFFADTAYTYQIYITSNGYHDRLIKLKPTKEGMTDTFFMKPIKAGDLVVFGNVQFKKSTAYLTTASEPSLDRIVNFLSNNPNVKLEISGHTSNEGDPLKNKALSLERAKAVISYLTEKGINKERLTPLGFGEEKPVSDNSTVSGRKLNRRVEFRVISK